MKLSELSKSELCELLMFLRGSMSSMIEIKIELFLQMRWQMKCEELIQKLHDPTVQNNLKKFVEINKQLDKLHNNADYYMWLDELK